jgi:hypothetical protein
MRFRFALRPTGILETKRLDGPFDPVQGDSCEQCGLTGPSRSRHPLKDLGGAKALGLGRE